jgi:alpha-tubulin suppressor-like RCC1 family protein
VAVATGQQHSLALGADGTVYQWGLESLEISSDTPDACPVYTYHRLESPTPVAGFPVGAHIVSIAAGGSLSAAVADDGGVYVWGLPDYTYQAAVHTPVAVQGFPSGVSVESVIVGNQNDYYALGSDGRVYHWNARSSAAQLFRAAPAGVAVRAISSMWGGVLALGADGMVYTSGPFGTPDVPVAGFPNGVTVTAIASGGSDRIQILAVGSDGRIYAWGSNNTGQLGLGDTEDRAHPTPIEVFPAGMPLTIVAAPGYSVALVALPLTAVEALRIAAGLAAARPADIRDANAVASGRGDERIDILDAVAIARKAAGYSTVDTP